MPFGAASLKSTPKQCVRCVQKCDVRARRWSVFNACVGVRLAVRLRAVCRLRSVEPRSSTSHLHAMTMSSVRACVCVCACVRGSECVLRRLPKGPIFCGARRHRCARRHRYSIFCSGCLHSLWVCTRLRALRRKDRPVPTAPLPCMQESAERVPRRRHPIA